MEKIAYDKVAQLMTDAASALRTISAQRDALQEKVAAYERRQEAEKVAHAMQDKGLSSEPFEQLVSNLEKMAESGKLHDVRNAVELVGPDMGAKLASISNDNPRQGGGSELESFILSGN